MHRRTLTIVAAAALLIACSPRTPVAPTTAGKVEVPWQRHCTLEGIHLADEAQRRHLEPFAHNCKPVDACILACIRKSCATEIKGGCYHACSSEVSEQESGAMADQFEAGTDPTCQVRPNNSFKPNALRYTNNMAQQLAMLSAPLRTSA